MALRGEDFDHGGADVGNFEIDDVIGLAFEVAHGEDVGFASGGAFEAPLSVADGLGEHVFDGALRHEVFVERFAKFEVAPGIFIGQDYGLAGETVANRIERRFLFAFRGAGACGMLRVFPILQDLCGCGHFGWNLRLQSSTRNGGWGTGKAVTC